MGVDGRASRGRSGRIVATVCLVLMQATCTGPGGSASHSSPTPRVPVVSPTLLATWASSATGADKPARTLSDGLEIVDVETGNGAGAHSQELLTVRYIIWLSDGRQVDSTDAHGQDFKFTLGAGQVIRGWDEGLVDMAVGGLRRLVIPAGLAYGASGVTDQSGVYVIPPNATLISLIRLVATTPST